MMRRCACKLGVFLLLGAIINVAVAWGCVMRIDPTSCTLSGDTRMWLERQPDLRNAAHPTRNLKLFGWIPRADDDYFHYQLAMRESKCVGARTVTISEDWRFQPGHMCFDCQPETNYIVTDVWAGFPMKCLVGECWWDYRQAPIVRGSFWKSREWPIRFVGAIAHVRNIDALGMKLPYTDILPYRPILIGLVVNSLCYALMAWLIATAPGFIRRRIRMKRNRCSACGYPIGTSPVCTECGTPVRG